MKKFALAISAVLLLYVAPRAFAAGDGSAGLSQEEVRTDLAKLRRVHSDESDRSSAISDDDGDDDGDRGGDHDGSGSQDHDGGNDGGHDDGGHDRD